MHEMIKLSLLAVTIRKDEERGIHSASCGKLVDINEDQVQKRGVVVAVWNKESPPRFRKMTPGSRNANRGHNSTKRHPERRKNEICDGREKKRAKFWAVLQRRVQRRGGPEKGGPTEGHPLPKPSFKN